MTIKSWSDFKEIWSVDYEFIPSGGNPPIPICYSAQNILSGEKISHWIKKNEKNPEYSIDNKSLFVGFFVSAELGCHLSLKFDIPLYVIDLFAECRCLTNGLPIGKNSLISYCEFFKVPHSNADYKKVMQNRITKGYPFSDKETSDILEYNMIDVDMTSGLFLKIKDKINLKFALLRGRYVSAIARMETIGIPIDVPSLNELLSCWNIIKEEMISRVDKDFGVYDGIIFKTKKFEEYLEKHEIPWERTATGLPRLDNKYFREQTKYYTELKPLQDLRWSIDQLKLKDLSVGNDGRNRSLISPFSSITGRNQPSSSHFIFGNAVWLRGLIKPPEGYSIAYIDYSAQEVSIAAALSGDKQLQSDILSGDPYLQFGKTAGVIPPGGTKKSHSDKRELIKTCFLGITYGMGAYGLAKRVKIPLIEAHALLKFMKNRYYQFFKWRDSFVDNAILSGKTHTPFNWNFQTIFLEKINTMYNWPMQSTGSDIIRLAVCLCFDNGVDVLCPVHDALLIQAPISEIESKLKIAQKCMEDATEYILSFRIKTEASIVQYPGRYRDEKGRGDLMWNIVWGILDNMSPSEKQKGRLQ